MEIRKFKNGKIRMQVNKNGYYWNDDGTINESFYHDEMFINSLYIEEIQGNFFIVDYETKNVYDFFNSYLLHNPLKFLLDELAEKGRIYLYPMPEGKRLFKQYIKEQENQ